MVSFDGLPTILFEAIMRSEALRETFSASPGWRCTLAATKAQDLEQTMYLLVIAWMYVALMMAAAEAVHPQGSLLGAAITFILYGVAPMALVIYLLRTPQRRAAARAAEAAAQASSDGGLAGTGSVGEPDDSAHAPGAPVPPVGEEPARVEQRTPRG